MPSRDLRNAGAWLGSLALVLGSSLLTTGCRERERPDAATTPPVEETVEHQPLEAVLRDHSPRLVSLPGVQAVYEGRTESGEPCIKVIVLELTDALREQLPDRLGGWPVVVEESDEIRPAQ